MLRLVTKSGLVKSIVGNSTRLAFAAAAIIVAWRIAILAGSPVAPSPPQIVAQSSIDAEIAQLYAACPMANVVDIQTVATSPERVDAILPPYRPTADRKADSPIEPAVPRIRYPIALRPAANMRVAQAPQTTQGDNDVRGDWLIDPNEWYSPDEQTAAGDESNVPAEAVSDAEPVSQPSLTTAPPTNAPLFLPPQAEPSLEQPTPDAQHPPSNIQQPASTIQQPISDTALPSPPGVFAPPAAPPRVDPHLELFAKNAYPSARECAECHEDIYHEWSVSAHAYAAVSPMFHKFEQKLNDISQGTVGYFCMRCHAPIATALSASRDEPLWNLPEVAREGVTCIACHRVQYVYGKSNGERRIEPGNVFAPVMGGIGGDGVAETIHRKQHFKVKTSAEEPGPGQNIHVEGIYFDPLTRSEFCTPCHQVAVHPGIKLEVVWEQYRASPACKKGIQCQDCHMGRVPGLPQGYNVGPVAKMAGKTVNECRKRSNHIFYGPNYSIAHPGIFPFHLKAGRWTMDEWLSFDWRAGWGTEEFENRVADGEVQVCFPPVWAEADDRYDAREIIEDNLAKLDRKRELRVEVMENGSHVAGPFFDSTLGRGQDLRFHYVVTNTNEGHNLLTASLGAQPQYWANVVLIGPDGRRLWETGYLDSYGDLANIHSVDVRNKLLPYDHQLFNLQTMFLITGAKGTDREFYVPVNVDIDQLPFIRPGVQPISVINHPPFIRMESQSLAPLGSRRVQYHVPGHLVCQPGTYRLSFRMRSRSEPMYLLRFCGATPEMERAMNEWMIDVHPISVEFTVP
jgi:nitrate/TMAO reductase-like tetraheme cytochrome c subunit